MTGIPDAVADTLAAEVRRRREWDEAPCLYTVRVTRGRPRLVPILLPDAIWDGRPPAGVLAHIADAAAANARLLQAMTGPDLYGAAFRCETWQVSAPQGDRAAWRQMVADGNARRVSTRPDRVEARQIWAVDRDRVSYLAGLERVSGTVQRIITRPDPGRDFIGNVPEALDRLVSALLGVTMPERSLRPD